MGKASLGFHAVGGSKPGSVVLDTNLRRNTSCCSPRENQTQRSRKFCLGGCDRNASVHGEYPVRGLEKFYCWLASPIDGLDNHGVVDRLERAGWADSVRQTWATVRQLG
jgi:hypothetical protein